MASEVAHPPVSSMIEPEPAAPRWPFSVSIVIPAFNEGRTIGQVIRAARERCPDAEIIVVDDASHDDTADQAAAAAARVIRRPYNIGNGAGVKTGIRAATGDVILILDGDGQHDPADIPRLLAHIGPYDMVIGARDREGQQNALRWIGNSALNRLGSYLVGMEMRDLTSGFRAMRREVIREFLHLLPRFDADHYVDALRDWVEHGAASEYALAPKEVVRGSAPRSSAVAEAAAEFELGQHLHHAGHVESARAHFRAAHRLQPENWTYKRNAWELVSPGIQGPTDFYDGDWLSDIKAAGPEHYYAPPDF